MEGGLLEALASVCCCKKKQSDDIKISKVVNSDGHKPQDKPEAPIPKRTRLQDEEEKDTTFDEAKTTASQPQVVATVAETSQPTDAPPQNTETQKSPETPSAPKEESRPTSEWQSVLDTVIASSEIDALLAAVESTVANATPDSNFTLISDAKTDPLTLYFHIGDHPTLNEKYHKFISSYSAPYDPKYFVLRNCLLSASERQQSNPNIAEYVTPVRRYCKEKKTYYMINVVRFKKVLTMTPKESVCIKAVKVLDNGDVVEHNVSIKHEKFPETPDKFERFEVLANPIFYRKVKGGLQAKSFNYVVPKSKMPMMMLKGIMNKSYNGTFTAISEIISKKEQSQEEIELMEKAFQV